MGGAAADLAVEQRPQPAAQRHERPSQAGRLGQAQRALERGRGAGPIAERVVGERLEPEQVDARPQVVAVDRLGGAGDGVQRRLGLALRQP